MIFGFRWFELLQKRKLKTFFVGTQEFLDIMVKVAKDFGMSDELIKLRFKENKYVRYIL